MLDSNLTIHIKLLFSIFSPKPLKSIYIDTTFCNEKCLYIPSREECLNEIVSIVEPWLSKGPNYIVYILCPYELAYEFVFVELYKRFGLKVNNYLY